MAILTFSYTLKVYRRLLKYEEYQITESAKQPNQYYNDLELGNSVSVSADKGKGRADPPRIVEHLVLKNEVDRHIGAGFGWSSSSGVERSTSIVSKGIVPSAKVSPTENEMRRSRSYHTERGVIRGEEYVSDPDDDDTDTIRGEGYSDTPGQGESKDRHIAPHDDEGDEDTKALLPGSQERRS